MTGGKSDGLSRMALMWAHAYCSLNVSKKVKRGKDGKLFLFMGWYAGGYTLPFSKEWELSGDLPLSRRELTFSNGCLPFQIALEAASPTYPAQMAL